MELFVTLIYNSVAKGSYKDIAIWKIFLCAVIDSHATILSNPSFLL